MTTMKVHTLIPVDHPARPHSLFADVALFCRRTKTRNTITSYKIGEVTCAKCRQLLEEFQEDLEYRKVQAKLSREAAA